jgi:hypothetical protein
VRFYSPVSGRGNVIRRNTFHDYFDGLGACPEETAGSTNETDVYENLVYNAGDDGMETDGTCSNVRIWGNTFHDVLGGISLAPVYTGPVYAIRNLIYRIGAGNNDYTGLAFKFNSGYDPSGPMFLFHNTVDAVLAGSSALDIKAPGDWTLVTARNNIWSGTAYALNNANPTQPLDLDYDDLYTTQAGELARWEGLADPHLHTLAELRAWLHGSGERRLRADPDQLADRQGRAAPRHQRRFPRHGARSRRVRIDRGATIALDRRRVGARGQRRYDDGDLHRPHVGGGEDASRRRVTAARGPARWSAEACGRSAWWFGMATAFDVPPAGYQPRCICSRALMISAMR